MRIRLVVPLIALSAMAMLSGACIAPPTPELDTVPPVVTVPGDLSVPAASLSGAFVDYDVYAIDQVDGSVQVTCAPAAGSEFPIGATTVECVASDSAGNIATGSFTVAVTNRVELLRAAINSSCALTESATLRCWGENGDTQLGDGTTVDRSSPVTNQYIENAVDLAVAGNHACAVLVTGGVVCWGYNADGQLGDSTQTATAQPVPVPGITNAVAVAAANGHSCALLDTGSIKCWGRNSRGQLGDGQGNHVNVRSLVPVDVVGITNATDITAGTAHTCAALADGTAKCWGAERWGAVGNAYSGGLTSFYNTPRLVLYDLTGVVEVSAGQNHTCALIVDGRVKCWGDNRSGQLGIPIVNNPVEPVSSIAVQVPSLVDITSISSGWNHTCALSANGDVTCWGYNANGQLGHATVSPSASPGPVLGLEDVTLLAAGVGHTCAVAAGAPKCWGSNNVGQLGNGTTAGSITPVDVIGG